MAASDSLWNKAVERWSRVGELGMEAALRGAGCSQQSILHTLDKVKKASYFHVDWLEGLIDIELGRCAVFATLGRGVSGEKFRLYAIGRTISDDEFAALCVNLSSNTNISTLQLDGLVLFDIVKGCTLLGHALAINSSLKTLHLKYAGIGSYGVRCLMNGLQSNSTLQILHLSGNPLTDEGICSVAQFLSNNKTLEFLGLDSTGSSLEGPKHMSWALMRNTTLESLSFASGSVGREGMKTLLNPLSLDTGENAILDPENQKNFSLKRLLLSANREYLESVTRMIQTNKSLNTLAFDCRNKKDCAPFLPTDWRDHFFPALEENDTLRGLDLFGFDGEEAYEALMDLVQNRNTGLEGVSFIDSGLESRQGQVDEELRVNKDYRTRLRGKPQTTTTSGRIVLCGYSFAGKTEICNTIKRIEHGTSFFHQFKMSWKKVMQTYPSLHKILRGRDAYKELTNRTRGFEVLALNKEPLKSVWDFAGQKEYYALHDYIFPDFKNSYFLYVCSCRLPPDTADLKGKLKGERCIRSEFEFWMRFLASDSKYVVRSHGRRVPRVRFILTKTDTLNHRQKEQIVSESRHVVGELKGVFKDVLDLWEGVEVVNAFSSEDVQRLLSASIENLTEILSHQEEYDVCEQVRSLLQSWSKSNPLKPVLSLREFYSLFRKQLEFDQLAEDGWKIVLTYLNDLGEIIFPKGIDFIVINPSWFGIDVLGPLINAFQEADRLQPEVSKCGCTFHGKRQFCGLYHRQGFVKRQDMEEHLEHALHSLDLQQSIPAEKLVDLMIHLEMCFKNELGGEDFSLFMPALFDDKDENAAKGLKKLEWPLTQTGHLKYLGRRLECKNRYTTFLTPGFFPRLQVHLRNYIQERGWTQNLGFEVGRNLICFAENGVEIFVEYAGDSDDFIDVLVRSSQPYSQTLKFIQKHVIQTIRMFCASPKGCPGVELIESVIRPLCVQELHLCVNRKAHSVLVSKLEEKLAEDKGYRHTWKDRLEGASDINLALDLLEGEGPHKRIMGDHEMGLLPKSSSNIHGLPKLFFPSIEDVGKLRRLEASLNLTKKIPIKLHLLCDHKDGSHKVDGQPGRTMTLNAKTGGYDLPLMKLTITLIWAGVHTSASVLGAGAALPQVDSWIESLFNVPDMPLDGEMLHQMMDSSTTLGPASDKEILKALDRYLKVDPHTQGLKEILRLEDGSSFIKDFQLRKVVYIEEDQKNRIGWVCKSHFFQGIRQGIVCSVPH